MVQISSRKSPHSSFEPLSSSFIFRCKSANAFKSATKREEICIIYRTRVFFSPLKKLRERFLFLVKFVLFLLKIEFP